MTSNPKYKDLSTEFFRESSTNTEPTFLRLVCWNAILIFRWNKMLARSSLYLHCLVSIKMSIYMNGTQWRRGVYRRNHIENERRVSVYRWPNDWSFLPDLYSKVFCLRPDRVLHTLNAQQWLRLRFWDSLCLWLACTVSKQNFLQTL